MSEVEYVYELVDSTDDDMYYSQGLFAKLLDAVLRITTAPCATDPDGHCENTIRQRELNKLTDVTGKVVYRVLWEYDYEDQDWKIKEQTNGVGGDE
jgi:hypothetical protein